MINNHRILIVYEFLLLIILLFQGSSQLDDNIKIIVLPFKTLQSPHSDISSNINISTTLIPNPIYTILNITTQSLIAIFDSGQYNFYMTSENCPENANYYIRKSSSFMNISHGLASERMILYRDYDLKTQQYGLFTKMKIKEYNDKKQCAVFGLQMNSKIYVYEITNSFVKTFQLNGNINSCQWTFKYTTDNEGLLILGDSPIAYDPMFKDKKYIEYHTKAVGQSDLVDFGIDFDEVIINNNTIGIKHVQFCHDLGVILVNKNVYEDMEKIFFGKYLADDICEKKWVFDKYGYIQCNSEKFKESDMNSFPTIYFKKVDMEYIFELNSKDLFSKQLDGKIYFLIIFDLNFSTTKIGKPFLKKYSLTVDNDKNTISLFLIDPDNKNLDTNENNNRNIVYIIILCIIVFILIGVSSFFAYKLYLKRKKNKKRANELDEDYEYLSKNNNNNYKNAEFKEGEDNTIGNLGI